MSQREDVQITEVAGLAQLGSWHLLDGIKDLVEVGSVYSTDSRGISTYTAQEEMDGRWDRRMAVQGGRMS